MSMKLGVQTARSITANAVLAACMVMFVAASADAATTVVRAGDSIQAAVNTAAPGDTIRLQRGTYQGGVQLAENGLSIRGAGAGKTMLVQTSPQQTGGCGICVEGDPFQRDGYVHDISIRGLSVVGFDTGLGALAVRGLWVADVEAKRSGTVGISVNTSYDVALLGIRSNTAGSSGVSLNAVKGATIANSDVRNSGGPGFEVFASGDGRIHHSTAIGNCSGVELRTGKGAPTVVIGLSAWRIDHVTAVDNTRRCRQGWPSAGAGIFALGGRGLRIAHNLVRRNGYDGASSSAGGIVITARPFDDMDASNPGGVTVERNVVLDNAPFDLRWDGSPVPPQLVSFDDNPCATSEPEGLCGL